jgi:hypothetical protein
LAEVMGIEKCRNLVPGLQPKEPPVAVQFATTKWNEWSSDQKTSPLPPMLYCHIDSSRRLTSRHKELPSLFEYSSSVSMGGCRLYRPETYDYDTSMKLGETAIQRNGDAVLNGGDAELTSTNARDQRRLKVSAGTQETAPPCGR